MQIVIPSTEEFYLQMDSHLTLTLVVKVLHTDFSFKGLSNVLNRLKNHYGHP